MIKHLIAAASLISLGQLNAATYVSGAGTTADPIVLNVGGGLTADIVLGAGTELITPDGGGIFSDLDTSGYILFSVGQSVDITFSNAFTGNITLFDVDTNPTATLEDQVTITDSSGTILTVIDTIGNITANNNPDLENDAQIAFINGQSSINLEHTGNFGSVAFTFEGITPVPEPSSSMLGVIGGVALLLRRKR